MDLIQKIRFGRVNNTEKSLFELSKEGKRKTNRVLNDSKEDIEEYDGIVRKMKWLLTNRYQNGRFRGYFQKQVDSINESIKIILGY